MYNTYVYYIRIAKITVSPMPANKAWTLKHDLNYANVMITLSPQYMYVQRMDISCEPIIQVKYMYM